MKPSKLPIQPVPALPPAPTPTSVVGSIPLRPEMVHIMQILANEVNGWTKNIANAQQGLEASNRNFQEYVNQCAGMLQVDKATMMFDPPTGTFIPKA